MEYEVVDVFAERPLEGNPLTVIKDASKLDPATMQAIALETNHSETTFVTGPATAAGLPTRIFTPQTELPFAGHPTLGTAFVMGADALDLQVGTIPIEREGDILWMTQKAASFGPVVDAEMVSASLGVEAVSAEIVSTGTPMLLVEVADSETLRDAALDEREYTGPKPACAYVFTTRGDHDVHARSFGSFVGIIEDAATGSAAGPLAALLDRRGELGDGRVIAQGMEMGRPSKLYLRGSAAAPEVGGKVQRVATGRFHL